MSPRTLLIAPIALFVAPYLVGQSTAVSPPPPVAQAYPQAAQPARQPGEQKVYTPAAETLIARSAADGVMEGFRKNYRTAENAPRLVVYVNRALLDSGSGQKPADARPAALADQQTVREVERLFGRVFRHAGAQLADQKIATALLPEQPGAHLTGDSAAKDREALAKVADIAIEVLISSRSLTLPGLSGDQTFPVPDIQATAIRLKDAAIVGQAAASDIIGKGLQAGRVLRQFDVSDITEATAIALMEDMLTGAK